jgi:hypothetical protein
MKKIFLLFCLSFLGVMAYSQDLKFTKGNVAPGAIATVPSYEEFIGGNIVVTDKNGAEYTFVKAEFTLVAKNGHDGRNISITLTQPAFPATDSKRIAKASFNGATCVFKNVVVKDKQGKEHTIDTVTFEVTDFSSR